MQSPGYLIQGRGSRRCRSCGCPPPSSWRSCRPPWRGGTRSACCQGHRRQRPDRWVRRRTPSPRWSATIVRAPCSWSKRPRMGKAPDILMYPLKGTKWWFVLFMRKFFEVHFVLQECWTIYCQCNISNKFTHTILLNLGIFINKTYWETCQSQGIHSKHFITPVLIKSLDLFLLYIV